MKIEKGKQYINIINKSIATINKIIVNSEDENIIHYQREPAQNIEGILYTDFFKPEYVFKALYKFFQN